MSSEPVRLRVPQQDGQALAHPPLDRAPSLALANRRLLDGASVTLLGRPLSELRPLARAGAVEAAREYLSRSGEPVPDVTSTALYLAGHQPELFHPGVWVKNFALNGLARRSGATPVNLVVDNDIAKTNLIHAPTVDENGIDRIELLLFDRWAEGTPYEERTVRDEAIFASVPQRLAEASSRWPFAPLLPQFWAEALPAAARTNLLGERFAAARRAVERCWGCHNLELPVSALCQTEGFAWFACDLLHNLPRFRALYNQAVHEYRRRHGIRDRSHPVPDLAAEGDWLEAPLWAWRAGQARRGRLMVRRAGDTLQMRVGQDPLPPLPLGRPEGAVASWRALRATGVKLRTRALTTTLYSRLLLGDLFLHGIGGGNYDALTDELLRSYYGIEPPGFVVLSATLLLPFAHGGPRSEDERRLYHEYRDLEWNPQRHLSPGSPPAAQELARAKAELAAARPEGRRERKEWFGELRRLTEALRPFVASQHRDIAEQLDACRRELAGAAVRRRRDYPFCIYPEAQLRPFCTRFLN